MPSSKYRRTGLYKSSKVGYHLILVNDKNPPFDSVQIIFTQSDFEHFMKAVNSLFKNYTKTVYDASMRQ